MEFSPPLVEPGGSDGATAASSTAAEGTMSVMDRASFIQANRDTIPFPSTSLELHLPVNAPEDVAAPARQRWNSPFEFFITCVGYAVGLGNFWRFPYLCYKHGGGAFLVPYSIVLVVIGMPLFLLELGVGQKFQVGPLQVWQRIHPALAGIGLTAALVTFFVALYYNVIVAWALWYLFHSFAYPLPWAADQGGANAFWEESTLHCRPRHAPNATCSWDGLDFGAEPPGAPGLFSPGLHRLRTASAPRLHRLRTASAPPHHCASAPPLPLRASAGEVVWPLFGCLVLAWLLVYCCVCKGVASIGKVSYHPRSLRTTRNISASRTPRTLARTVYTLPTVGGAVHGHLPVRRAAGAAGAGRDAARRTARPAVLPHPQLEQARQPDGVDRRCLTDLLQLRRRLGHAGRLRLVQRPVAQLRARRGLGLRLP